MLNKTRTLSILGLTAALGAAAPAMADFNFNDFTDATGMTLVGSATKTSNSLMLTPATRGLSGAAWYTAAKQDVAGGFTATMTIRIPAVNGGGADGFALVIQNSSPTALGSSGGGIGYGTNPTFGLAGIPNSLAVEVDLWNNTGQWNDLSSSHISIQTRGLLENSPEQEYSIGSANIPDFVAGESHTIQLSYADGVLAVNVDGVSTPLLSVNVDLSTLLALDNGTAWIGVTAATGAQQDSEAHELQSFRFVTPTILPAPGSAALFSAGALLIGKRRRR